MPHYHSFRVTIPDPKNKGADLPVMSMRTAPATPQWPQHWNARNRVHTRRARCLLLHMSAFGFVGGAAGQQGGRDSGEARTVCAVPRKVEVTRHRPFFFSFVRSPR